MGMADLPQEIKIPADLVAGSVVGAAWMNWLQGGLEIAGLVLAVIYGVARVYDTKLFRDFKMWLRTRNIKKDE